MLRRLRFHYSIRDVPSLLTTPLGWRRCAAGLAYYGWPLLAPMTAAYRRSVLRRTRVVAVTGSVGKTTTARAAVTALGGRPSRYIASNYRGFVTFALLRARPWGPAVVELGISGRGQMARYARILRPDVAVVTAIASDHSRAVGTAEDIRDEKAHIVRALSTRGVAILNGDDPNVRWMATQTRARVVTFGLGTDNDVRASDIRLNWPHGMSFQLHGGDHRCLLTTRLLGRPMVYSLLAGAAVALTEGRSLADIARRLATLPPTPGRLEVVPLASGVILLRDEFKGTEEATAAALDLLAEVPAARKVAVLGEVSDLVGPQGNVYRRLGARLSRSATEVLFVTHGRPTAYRAGAAGAGLPRAAMRHVDTGPGGAVAALREASLQPGDVVLVKGRDNQRLGRVSLALMGRDVRCELLECNVTLLRCDTCPMLERGWTGRRVVW
jgi:UDP-N-acetylmuramyl pentapeptide synthase